MDIFGTEKIHIRRKEALLKVAKLYPALSKKQQETLVDQIYRLGEILVDIIE